MRRCYIARYPLTHDKKDLSEVILKTADYWSEDMRKYWESLAVNRRENEPMLQAWYVDDNAAVCLATTNQPFKLN